MLLSKPNAQEWPVSGAGEILAGGAGMAERIVSAIFIALRYLLSEKRTEGFVSLGSAKPGSASFSGRR